MTVMLVGGVVKHSTESAQYGRYVCMYVHHEQQLARTLVHEGGI